MCRPRYLLFLILLALAGCVGSVERLPDPGPPKRVVLVVLAGDNNLAEEVSWRLDALMQGWTPMMGPLFVLEDRPSINAPRLLRLVCDDTDGKHYRTLASYPYLTDTTSEELWRTVLADVMRQSHPAAHMSIVLFSHGTGWLPEGMLAEPRGLLSDNGREMSPELLGEILPADRVDYLLFDMCFTAGVEVAYALRERVPLLLVSSAEMVSPALSGSSKDRSFHEFPSNRGAAGRIVAPVTLSGHELRHTFRSLRYTEKQIPTLRIYYKGKIYRKELDLTRFFRDQGLKPDETPVQDYKIVVVINKDDILIYLSGGSRVVDWQDGGSITGSL